MNSARRFPSRGYRRHENFYATLECTESGDPKTARVFVAFRPSGLSTEAVDFSAEIRKLEQKARKLQKEIFADLTAQQKVQLARHPGRPYMLDYVQLLMDDFIELHGDRSFHDDAAIIGGMAQFDEWEVLVLGHQKGRNTKDNLHRNFGMARPEGYRKATRLMRMAM